MHNRKQPRAENTWYEVDTQRREEKKKTQTQRKKNDGEEKITKHGKTGCYA